MRKALAVGAGLALLVVLYAAAGYWLAPGYVRGALAGLAARQGLSFDATSVQTDPFALRVVLEGVTLRGPEGREVVKGAHASAELAWASLWRRGWIAAGTYQAAAQLPGGGGRIASHGTIALAKDRLALGEVSLQGSELAYAGIELPQAKVYAPRIQLPLREPFEVTAQASVAPRGTVSAQGSLGIAPFQADLRVQAHAVPLAPAQRWLPKQAALRIHSGSFSGEGRLRLGEGKSAYQGSAAIDALRLDERGSGALLLAWERAETEALSVAFSPFRLEIGELLARAPQGRLVIAQDGTVNFAAALAGAGGGGEPLHASVRRLRIEKGTLQFADRSLANPFEVTLRELSGSITGLGNASSEPARIRLAGRVQPYGSARIRGTVDLDAPTKLADVTASLQNLRLEAFNPYIAKFAGYRIESGRLSANLRYQLREGRLVGTNRLAFEQMRLGEKLEARGLLDLPLELVVALLADSQGRIDLEIPVRGNLNDPQFDLGAIVAHAFGNVLHKIVSAPFRALAKLVGGKDAIDEEAGTVAFQPGSSALSPPAEEGVARLAQTLAERPQLGVEVRGGYDPARDLEALRLRSAREELARAAGVRAPPDLADPKVVRAAEALYLKRLGDRAALKELRKSEERYGRALLQSLAAAVPAVEGATQALARERAEAVRVALIDHGVDAARVSVGETRETGAAETGVATELALNAGGSAAAGASDAGEGGRTGRVLHGGGRHD